MIVMTMLCGSRAWRQAARWGRGRARVGMMMTMKQGFPIRREQEMPKVYQFQDVEKKVYEWWEGNGYFKPVGDGKGEKKAFVVCMPPPNVTGVLHMGHSMFVALQDILCRFHRMRGAPTLYLPGTEPGSLEK